MKTSIPISAPPRRTYLQIHPVDNVMVALQDLPAGTMLSYDDQTLGLSSGVAAKHKVVTEALAVSDAVLMYGVRVGRAIQPISWGEVIGTANVQHEAEPYGLDRRQPWA